ncbi:hypothetical protein EHS25_007966, partial [Saitozyma podzolica]
RSNYDLYTKGGVTLSTERFGTHLGWKPYRSDEAFADDTHYAFCLVTTKCLPDVNPDAKLLADAIASGKVGAWALIQNGLGIEEDLYQAVKHLSTPIISSLAWIGIMTNPRRIGCQLARPGHACFGHIPPLPCVPAGQDAAVGAETGVLEEGEGGVGALGGDTAGWRSECEGDRSRRRDQVQQEHLELRLVLHPGLVRTRPASWYDIDPWITQPMRDFMREIVDVGFEAGLLKEGMIQYPGGDLMGSRESVAEACWTRTPRPPLRSSRSSRCPMRGNAGGGHKMSLWERRDGPTHRSEVIVGAVVRLAKQIGVKTPLLDYTYALMKGLQVEILEQQEAKREAAKKTLTA